MLVSLKSLECVYCQVEPEGDNYSLFCFCLHQARTHAALHEVKVNTNLETALFRDNTGLKYAKGTALGCGRLVL